MLGTAELILPLPALGMPDWDGYAAALFVDAGNVWLSGNAGEATSDEEPWRSLIPTLRWAVGGGMRVATPVGPLQFDIASNLQSLWTSGARRALLVDAWEEPPWRVHLTLGATF